MSIKPFLNEKTIFLNCFVAFVSFGFSQSYGDAAFYKDAQWGGLSYGFLTPYKSYVSASASSGSTSAQTSITTLTRRLRGL